MTSKNIKKNITSIFLSAWACLFTTLYIAEIHNMSDQPHGTDFYKFYLSAQSFLAGDEIYWPSPKKNIPISHCYIPESLNKKSHTRPQPPADSHPGYQQCLHPNLNPPAFSIIITPFAQLDFVLAWWFWSALSIAAGVAAAILLANEVGFKNRNHLLIAVLLLFSWYPARINIEYGQVGLWLALAMVLAWRDLRRGRESRAGLVIGITASLKLFVGLFIIGLIIQKKWKAAITFIAAISIIAIIGLMTSGVDGINGYIVALSEITWYASNWNASFKGLFSRLLGGADTPGLFEAALFSKVFTLTFSLIFLMVGLLQIMEINKNISIATRLPSSEKNKTAADSLFAVTLTTMLLLSPLGWVYYFPILIIPAIICLRPVAKEKPALITITGVWIFYALTVLPFGLLSTDKFTSLEQWIWSGALYSYALLILFFTVIYHLRNPILSTRTAAFPSIIKSSADNVPIQKIQQNPHVTQENSSCR